MVDLFGSLMVACAHSPGLNSIHNLGLVGHIEDIVVNKDQQGKKLGLRIIEALDYIAEKVGCYKVSLPTISFCLRGYCIFSSPQSLYGTSSGSRPNLPN